MRGTVTQRCDWQGDMQSKRSLRYQPTRLPQLVVGTQKDDAKQAAEKNVEPAKRGPDSAQEFGKRSTPYITTMKTGSSPLPLPNPGPSLKRPKSKGASTATLNASVAKAALSNLGANGVLKMEEPVPTVKFNLDKPPMFCMRMGKFLEQELAKISPTGGKMQEHYERVQVWIPVARAINQHDLMS